MNAKDFENITTVQQARDLLPEFLPMGNDLIKRDTLLFFDKATVQDLLEIPNAELRQMMIITYKGGSEFGGGLAGFLRDGGGKVVRSAAGTDEDDYQYAEIIEFKINNTPNYFLKVINRTVDEKFSTMTPQEAESAGLTSDGYKIYLLGLIGTPDDYDYMADAVGASWCYEPGEYFPDAEA